MARSGWSTSNYLSVVAAAATAVPLSMTAWAKTATPNTGANMNVLGLYNNTSGTRRNSFLIGLGTSGLAGAVTSNASGQSRSDAGAVTANAWVHLGGVFSSITSRKAYLNGVAGTADTTSSTPSGINASAIGVSVGSSIAEPFNGTIAECAIWSIALTDADMVTLATGVSPLLVHPEALIGYWPLVGNNSPENNLLSNTAAMSITGSLTAAAHPRIILPHRRQVA